MFSHAYLHLACANALQGKTYTGLLYGIDRPCRTCNGFHGTRASQLPETDKTEYMASRIAKKANAKQTMIGLLIASDGRMVVSTSSGDAHANRRFVTAAVQELYPDSIQIAPDVDLAAIPTVAGAPVPDAVRTGCQPPGCPVPGRCAAIKVVSYALTNGWPRPYVMTETWSQRNQAAQDVAREGRGQQLAPFKDSEPIESCYSCGALVPTMLCGA